LKLKQINTTKIQNNMKTNTRIILLGVITAWLSILGVVQAQTVLWSENFDDGNGNSRWYADTGVWQIGSPTIGPSTNSAGYRTHSGPYCATTGLTANYPSGMNSRLIRIQTFAVPSANQYPRIRFWHWYNFSGNEGSGVSDYGVVEIKVGTKAWQEVSPHYTSYSGDWTYESVDLSAYAGQTVQIAFQAVSSGGSGPGWYVDDISVITGTPVFNNPEGFEAGIGDWYAEQGTWQVGSPEKSGGAPTNSLGAQAHSGTNCAVTLLNANYPNSLNSRFISPIFILPPASLSPYLRFWHWYNFSGNEGSGVSDYGVVEIKGTNGTWQTISPNYSGSAGIYWTEPFIDLTSFGGQTVQMAFQAVSSGGSGSGWYVDDVQISPYIIPLPSPNPLPAIPNTNILETVLWQYTPTVTGSGYTFGLSNAPSGMTVNSSSGTISWTPTEAQGPSTNGPITYAVYQSSSTVAWTNFTVIVLESNLPPAFTSTLGTQTVYATTTMNVSDGATDQDIPANTLTYAIVSALSPSGVTINPNTGLVTWTPTTGQVGTTNIYVSVTDYNPWAVNSQQLSVTNSFSVIVKGLTAPTWTSQPVSDVVGIGSGFSFTASATGFPTPTYQWQYSTNGSTWSNLNGATGASYQLGSSGMTNIGYYRVLAANSVNTNASASVSLTFLNINMYAGLNILGPLNANYNIQSTANLASNWVTLTNISLPTQPYVYIDYNSPTNSKQFYRANPQ
jgi:hypothetical protein